MEGIYKIQSRIKPDRIYIGSSINIKHRLSQHKSALKRGVHNSGKLQNHVNKYGLEDLKFEMLLGCSNDDLISFEQFYIDSLNPYFNIRKKAENNFGMKHSEETKEKLRQFFIGKKLCPQHKENISKSLIGKKRTQEQRLKLSQSKMGYKNPLFGKHLTDEQKRKLSERNKNLIFTDEHKRRISEMKKGTKKGIDNHNSKIVLNNQSGVYYFSAREAHDSLGKKISYRYFLSMLQGVERNKTNYIYI